MRLTKLSLRHFRNLDVLELHPHEALNLIVGPNASGKTNLCEALYYASRGLLLKGERQRELIAWGEDWSRIELEVGFDRLCIHLNGAESRKAIELNDEAVGQAEAFQALKVLIFTPDDLQVIKGSPSRRRRYLDRAIADLSPAYRLDALEYDQIVRRKNALLRRERVDRDLLAVYNEELVDRGARIVRARLEYLSHLEAPLDEAHRRLTGQPGSRLRLIYDSVVNYADSQDQDQDQDPRTPLARAVEARSLEERRRAMALVGPHRDELRFDLDGVDLRRYGSQGQQKTAMVALKLAQLELCHRHFGEYPVLVMDDVLSELDPQRARLLLDHLPRGLQIFLTETELDEPLAARAGRIYRLEGGRVEVEEVSRK